jgi:ribose/xylose/arabinose/galactoside ABC-type transport system permease subunit
MRINRAFRTYGPALVVFLVAWSLLLVRYTGINQGAMYPVLNNFPLLGLAALGVGVTIIGGELDLSIASVAAVSGMLAVKMQALGLVPAIAVTCAAGIAMGALQGYLIARLKIASVVFTVGTLVFLQGVGYLISEHALLVRNLALGDPLNRRFGPISISIALSLLVFAGVGIFLVLTRPGREIYASGGDRREAMTAGVNVRRAVVICFAISGGCGALAGSVAAFEGGSADPSSFSALLLGAVSAALVGGVRMSGGYGSVINIVLGVCVLASVAAGMANQGRPDYVTQLVTGCLLIAVISVESVAMRVRKVRPARKILAAPD